MAALATSEDVAVLWQPLTDAQTATADVLLARVSALIRLRIPDIDAQVTADPNVLALTTGVVVDAVLRVLRNPEGYTSETVGAYSYSRDSDSPSGLYLTDAEWALLLPEEVPAPVSGAFSIRPGPL